MHWSEAAQQAQGAVLKAIPTEWKLPKPQSEYFEDIRSVPRRCGILTAQQIQITEQSARKLVQRLTAQEITSVEVVEAFCARAAIAQQLVNCLAAFFPEEALQRARELDHHLRSTGKPVGPLHGLPIALKDTFDIVGKATTYGYAANVNLIADRDSAIVQVLREAGAVFYAKTTMPQTGMALETVSPLFGRTLNPHNPNLVAGGSSGGDAALVALYGSPLAPSTDIGGSIRAPAAFNGLYGIRPSADRIPKRGMRSVEHGQVNIRVSCGPVCNHIEDLETFTQIINAYPRAQYDTTAVPVRWRELPIPTRKLAFGLLEFDDVVRPHPPILRALRETAAKLKAQGHDVIPFKVPFDCWECSLVTFKLYYQAGIDDTKQLLAQAGETLIPAIQQMLEVYDPKPLSAEEVLKCAWTQNKYKEKFCDAWDQTAKLTATSRPIDGLLCPVAPSAGYPHDFLPWWGYTTLFNILDYPSTVLPIKDFKISEQSDPKDLQYRPRNDNPFDKSNHEMYDPVLFQQQPVTIQIVARPFEDEELIRVTEAVDGVVNGSKIPNGVNGSVH